MSRRMIAAEVLKLVRRRGQMVVALMLTVGAVAAGYAITWGYHLSDAVKYGPAGGSHNLEGAMWVIATVGGVAAVLIGTTAGVGDQSAGVFRELVVTGRSRLVLFACRIPGAQSCSYRWCCWRSPWRSVARSLWRADWPRRAGR